MTTEWAYLPNAAHIDRILADAKARPDVWAAARAAARDAALDAALDAARDAARAAAWDAAWDAALDAALDAARDAARAAAWDAVLDAALDAARDAARAAAWDAVRALVAWGDCAGLIELEPDALRLLAACDHHAAILLLPACIALNSKGTT